MSIVFLLVDLINWEEVIDIFHVRCLPKHAQACPYRTKIALSPILLLNNVYFSILNLFNYFCYPIILAKQQLNFKNFKYNSDICQFFLNWVESNFGLLLLLFKIPSLRIIYGLRNPIHFQILNIALLVHFIFTGVQTSSACYILLIYLPIGMICNEKLLSYFKDPCRQSF